MITIPYPIIVEGKYDKIKLNSIVNAKVITTEGFGIFSDKEKLHLIRALSEKSKIILLTDSDGGGHIIRAYIKTAIPKDRLINLYIPRVEGKEKRKSVGSKEGTLGVEGIDKSKLLEILSPFSLENERAIHSDITKADLYALGLSGRDNSSMLRARLLERLNMPTSMSPNAMLQAISILYTKEEIIDILKEL